MILLILLFILGVVVPFIGLYKIFEKAGYEGWKGLVPFLNYSIWLKIIGKPKWWMIFLVIPFINMIALLLMRADLANHFGKRSFVDHLGAWLLPFIYLPYLGFSDLKLVGYSDKDKLKRGTIREWADAIVFAVIAATIIRTFLIEAFTIPSSSMQGTLLNGDYLFVSKLSYGPRIPMTPLSVPFVHSSIPVINTKSYIESVQLPYYRLPGFGKVQRNDVVVFNFPEGDTVAVERSNSSYYGIIRTKKREFEMEKLKTSARDWVQQNNTIVYRPIDKEDNYIKRCVAIAGDTLLIKKRTLYINGKPAYFAPTAQFNYDIKCNEGSILNPQRMMDLGMVNYEQGFPAPSRPDYFDEALPLSNANAEKIKSFPNVKEITPQQLDSGAYLQQMVDGNYNAETTAELMDDVFPHSPKFKWNRDNYGPLVIPKKGMSIKLTIDSLPLYERLITVYEKNKLEVKDKKIFINGQEANSYTFQQDYYWMMGDNRHNSLDSRYWGYVPDDHVVGKGVFIWMSLDPRPEIKAIKKFIWSRAFTFISPEGLSRSYFVPFLVVLLGFFGWQWYKGKKELKNQKRKK